MSKPPRNLAVDASLGVPLVRQVYAAIKDQIDRGRLRHGEQLPSMRDLSEQTSVSVAVVRQAINQLTADGYLRVDPRRGVYVSKPSIRVRDVALVLPMIRSHYLGRLVEGIHEGFAGTSCRLILETAQDSYDEQIELLARLDRAFIAGVIIAPPPFQRYAEAIRQIQDRGLPCVQTLIALDQLNAPAVVCDEFETGRQAVEKLIEAGHRRIGVLDNNADARTSHELRVGMDAALRQINLRFGDIPVVEGDAAALDGEHPYEDSQKAAEVMLDRYPEVTGLVGVTPNRAIGGFLAARRRGLRVPGDLSILGVGGDVGSLSVLAPGITMIDRPTEAIGRRAAVMIQQMIDGQHQTYRSIQLQPVTRERGSIGPARPAAETASESG